MWKLIPGFDSVEVSSAGEIRRHGRVCRQGTHVRGYRVVHFGKGRHFVHRLVLLAFVGPPPSAAHESLHLDNDPTNNRPENLRWGTHAENMALDKGNNHAHRGSANPNVRVSHADVERIRAAYANRKHRHWGRKALAAELGISEKQVWLIGANRLGGWSQ